MKVLHVVGTVGSAFGGPIRSIGGIAACLPEYRHVVTGICEGDRATALKVQMIEGRRIGRNIAVRPRSVTSCLTEVDPSIVHIHGCLHAIYLEFAVAAKAANIPILVSPRSDLMVPAGAGVIRQGARIAARLFFNRFARALHATSELEAESLGDGPAVKAMIPNVFEPIVSSINDVDGRSGYLYLGRVSARKNVDSLVRAWMCLPDDHKDRHGLVVAGAVPAGEPDPLGPSLRADAAQLGAQFVGHVDGCEKERLLRSSRVIVNPSDFENFGHSIAEGLAAGLLIVVGPATPFSSVAQARGLGVVVDSPRSEASLGRAMMAANRMSTQPAEALDALRPYSPTVLGVAYDELYRKAGAI